MKFIPCEKCRNNREGLPPGYYWASPNKKLAAECECHYKWEIQSQGEKLFKHYGFNEKYWNYNPRSYVGAKSLADKNRLMNYILQFEENPEVRKLLVYMYGPNGTQKTSLANFVGKSLILKGFVVRYILMNNLIKDLQDMEFNEDIKAKVEKLNEADLLIIDEAFDTTKVTVYKSGYQLPYLDSFLRERYDQDRRSTLFISNVTPQDISVDKFGASLQNFMVRTTINSFLTFQDEYIRQQGVGVPVPDASLFKIRRRVKTNG